ncbi:MAG: hypothetical protein K0S23_791 [Fluviicola sp.]|jgi:hypothetical protein|uniref:hypothetical protein n=1 Tax=Fluviicola sp. TaxID=1917219 RepID=UPI00262CAAF0|nr:hypothetical protein [Fluviicola sp.]MDF3026484.1 hypothetical protein [Fluviicola sp.]
MNPEKRHIIDDLKVAPVQMPSDSYFEDLKKNILKEIGNDRLNKNEKTRIIPMYKRWYVWGSAAAILAFAILLFRNNTNPSTDSEPVNFSSVSDEEIYQYLSENIEDLDTETIALHLSDEAVAQNETSENVEAPKQTISSGVTLLDNIKDEEILDYLDDESGELDEYLLIES